MTGNMIHVNKALRNSQYFLNELFLPEIYSAATIEDFLRNKSEIKPTKKILPWGCLVNGGVIVMFETSVMYNPINSTKGVLNDLTASLEVSLMRRFNGFSWIIEDEKRLYTPHIYFKPDEGSIFLSYYKTSGPQTAETAREKDFYFSMIPAF